VEEEEGGEDTGLVGSMVRVVAAMAGGDMGRVGNMVPESDRPRFG
jgi:hypothetical protein